MIDLEGLEKLRAEGTAGDWRTVGDKSPNMTGVHAGPHTSGDSYLLFTLINDPNDDGPMGEGGLLPETVAQWKADAALIVAAVNALPELIAMARENAVLKQLAPEYFRWTGGPDQTEDPEWACDKLKYGGAHFENIGTPEVRLVVYDDQDRRWVAEPGDYIVRDGNGLTVLPARYRCQHGS